jgi:hypothetical protein
MLYYLLQREGGALYSMNLMLSEEEARRYGQEGEMVPVKALVVWTDVGKLENFRIFLSVEQENPHSPFAELIRNMRDEQVDVVELDSAGMRGNLRRSLHDAPFLLLNPGPEQQVLKVEELLAQMTDETPKITGPPRSDFKMNELEQAVGKTIAAVEYGPVEGLAGWAHEGEAIVLHFTDNTALSIEIGSNAGNLASEHPNLEPEDFHADLIPLWRDRARPT